MKKRFNERVREWFLSRGHFISKRIETSQVIEFIQTLQPAYPQDRLIRLGADHDGGYLIPDDLDDIKLCLSPGVSDEASFEEDLLKRGIRSYLCDYSVDEPPVKLPDCVFKKKFLGVKDDEVFQTLETWMNNHQLIDVEDDLIMQMDIEGFEYPVLLSTPDSILRRFRIIVLEVHDLFNLFDPASFRIMEQTFAKLLNQFRVAHIHPNGYGKSVVVDGHEFPRIIEMTLIRKDRFDGDAGKITMPHPLDKSCIPDREDMVLPKFWYE